MKLKKAYIYFIWFIGLSVFFSACYYLSYRHALNEFNSRAIERYNGYSELIDNSNTEPDTTIQMNDTISTIKNPVDTIQASTKYILVNYDVSSGKEDIQELNPPAFLVGLTREGVEDYLISYMEDLTLSEYNNGLLSFELMKFSGDEVILKKTYDESIVPYRFYLVVKDGFVIVYNSDLKSVHTYTGIEAQYLPEKDRIALSKGIYINSEDELYSLLESYSS